jgi:hypothetical protein
LLHVHHKKIKRSRDRFPKLISYPVILYYFGRYTSFVKEKYRRIVHKIREIADYDNLKNLTVYELIGHKHGNRNNSHISDTGNS